VKFLNNYYSYIIKAWKAEKPTEDDEEESGGGGGYTNSTRS